MGETPDPETLFELLGDDYVRTILRAASEKPMSVKELSQECDSALSTVYERVDDLSEAGVLVEQTRIEADGSHHSVYRTQLDELTVRIARGEFDVELKTRNPTAERFTRMWQDIREV